MPNSLNQLAQQQQDLMLGRDIERRGRFVGDDQARRAGERRGDQQPLALAAGELVRIAVQHGLGIGHLQAPQQVDQTGDVRSRSRRAGRPAHASA